MKTDRSLRTRHLQSLNHAFFLRIAVPLFVMIGLFYSGPVPSALAVPAVNHATPSAVESTPVTQPGEPRVSVMVELGAPPVAVIYAANQAVGDVSAASLSAVTRTYLRTLEAAQTQLAEQLTAAGAVEIFRVQRVYNGIAVRASDSQVKAIATLPGVKAIHPLIPKQPTNARSVPYTGAPSLWASTGMDVVKLAGEGMRIAVIDTGIDYLHTDFGGPGTGYADNDPTVITDTLNIFPGVKVSGGYDFAGEDYDADPDNASYQPVPHPDPDPMDCYAHGTHVAGTVAGYGVDWSGAQYDGPYDTPLDFSQFQIGPGMAPLAKIYALKVFGCQGSTDLTDLAIEWAVDPNGDGDFSDHVDVINMSLGSPFGSVYDTSAVASDNAALAGVIVVASAGNAGDTYFATGSPAVADRVISVAAVWLPDPTSGAEAMISSFSARGPRTPDSALKPDIAAPGEGITSAASETGNEGRPLSGTSMAAPHVAGAMALLRQAHPDWSVEELKALAMNSANFPAGTASGVPYGPTRTGAGVIDLSAAVTTTLLAYNAYVPGAVSLSFGVPEVLDTITITRTLRLVNKGLTTTVVSLTYEALNDLPGASVDIAITSPITIVAGGQVDAPVRMNVVATELQHVRDPATNEKQILPRHWLAEETGFVIITPADADHALTKMLRVPLHAAPRPAAELRADGPLDIGSEMAGAIVLTGTGIHGENPPVGVISTVSAFELAYSRPNTPGPAASEVIDPLAYGDLRHVGVTSDYPQRESLDETMLYFGIATVEPWSSPNRLRVNIYIDANGDGQDDYLLFNSSEAGFTNDNRFSDAFVTVVEDLETGKFSRRHLLNVLSALAFDTGVYNNSVMVLPVRAVDIGLDGGVGQFRYRVETEVAEEEEVQDQTPRLVYDARKPGLDLFTDNPSAPLIEAGDGAMIGARLDVVNYAANQSGGMLLLHHHNRTGAHAEAPPLRLDLPEKLYLPVVMGE